MYGVTFVVIIHEYFATKVGIRGGDFFPNSFRLLNLVVFIT